MTEARGRAALVTGAGSGIGRAIARRLARDGFRVAVNDVDATATGRAAAEIDGLPVVADVGDRAAVGRMVGEAVGALGRLDVLVNNAGICRLGAIADFPEADWRATFRVNVDGVFFCCQAAVPSMVRQGRGNIVNIASWSGKSGAPYFGPYCASKFAVIGLTQSLAREVAAHGIRVNAVCPGIVGGTEMRARVDDAARALGRPTGAERVGLIPLGRLAEPDDVAAVVAFLVSDEARYMTGQAINVTGGLWMH
ncbi:MAG TPA: SDR family NAD(P)-dependent oxidoreductase [Methylomirabilota bacterium]|nr:SDR family NAD(P)-dependent oxidoreductase [Methylomirabilota bacterium]